MSPQDERVKFAKQWIDDMTASIMKIFESNHKVDLKENKSEVTEADRKTEMDFRTTVANVFPADGIIGEEFLEQNCEGKEYTWTIDPIDGTRAFVHGVPFFGTMIGLYKNKESVFGIIKYHALGETIFAVKGEGTFWKDSKCAEFIKCKVSETGSFPEATLCTSGEEYFKSSGTTSFFEEIKNSVKFWRTWGDCYGYSLVARGKIDIMVDPRLMIWDVTPLKVIMEEAGAVFVSIRGREEGIDSNSAITMNKKLWKKFHFRLDVN